MKKTIIYLLFVVGNVYSITYFNFSENINPLQMKESSNYVLKNNIYDFKNKYNQLRFVFLNNFNFIYQYSRIIELTGNEHTFSLKNDSQFFLNYKPLSFFDVGLTGEIPLRLKRPVHARWSEEMSPPIMSIKKLYVDFNLWDYNRFRFGKAPSLLYDYPRLPMVDPLFYSFNEGGITFQNGNKVDGVFSPMPVISGYRDIPLIYSGLFPIENIQLSYLLNIKGFELGFSINNDGDSLASVSSFHYGGKAGYESKNVKVLYAFDIGTRGSVPIKNYLFMNKVSVYGGDDIKQIGGYWVLGLEGAVFQHGIRHSFLRNMGMETGRKKDLLFFNKYPFNEFIIPNDKDDQSSWGYGYVLYFDLNDLWNYVSFHVDFSAYDPSFSNNMISEFTNQTTNEDYTYKGLYDTKYRVTLSGKLKLIDGLTASFIFVYTMDPVYENYSSSGKYVPYFFTEWWEGNHRERGNYDIVVLLSYKIGASVNI